MTETWGDMIFSGFTKKDKPEKMTNEQIAKSIADQMRFAKGGVRYEKLVRLVWLALNEKDQTNEHKT